MKNQGLIWEVVVIIIALVILKFAFDFDIIDWLRSDGFQDILKYIKEVFLTLWNSISNLFQK